MSTWVGPSNLSAGSASSLCLFYRWRWVLVPGWESTCLSAHIQQRIGEQAERRLLDPYEQRSQPCSPVPPTEIRLFAFFYLWTLVDLSLPVLLTSGNLLGSCMLTETQRRPRGDPEQVFSTGSLLHYQTSHLWSQFPVLCFLPTSSQPLPRTLNLHYC